MWTDAEANQIFTNDTDKARYKNAERLHIKWPKIQLMTIPNPTKKKNKEAREYIQFLKLFHNIKLRGRTPICKCNVSHLHSVPLKCAKNVGIYFDVKPSILDKIIDKLIGKEQGRCNCMSD